MDTQNTKIHIRLWNRDFWRLALACLLLASAAYMMIPVLPDMLSSHFSCIEIGAVMAIPALGLIAVGGFCSFFVQHYRRGRVCCFSILVFILTLIGISTMNIEADGVSLTMLLLLRFLMGASFGLAEMIILSTLILDTCESFYRTEANHSVTWFYRMSLCIGPMVALVTTLLRGNQSVFISAMGFAVSAMLMIFTVNFPFRQPDDTFSIWSFDRFFLLDGWILTLNMALISLTTGIVLSMPLSLTSYAMFMVGFLIALLSQRFVFQDADLKSEIVSGLILQGASLLIFYTKDSMAINYIFPVLFSIGMALCTSRFLLFFIKMSRHCQRSTSQSTYIVVWETGLALGLGAGLAFMSDALETKILTSLSLIVVALILYNVYTHKWYMQNKNR